MHLRAIDLLLFQKLHVRWRCSNLQIIRVCVGPGYNNTMYKTCHLLDIWYVSEKEGIEIDSKAL
jgi:hypothetical protein